jgi:hypothetical protein
MEPLPHLLLGIDIDLNLQSYMLMQWNKKGIARSKILV